MPENIKTIIKYGNPALYEKAKPVEDPSAPHIQKLIEDMRATLEYHQAAGLAAPQIGVPLSIALYHVPTSTDNPKYALTPEYDPQGVPLTVMINPTITPLGEEMADAWEGCLSVPGMLGKIARYKSVHLTYITLEGKSVWKEAHGFHARVLQHECDHLKGILYPMRLQDIRSLGYQDEILASGGVIL